MITVTGRALTHDGEPRRFDHIAAVPSVPESTVPTGEHLLEGGVTRPSAANGRWSLPLHKVAGVTYGIADGTEVRLLVCDDHDDATTIAWASLPLGVPPEQVETGQILGIGSVTSDGEGGMKITLTDGRVFTIPLERGPAGPANALSIGTVTTGEPDSEASATITGESPEQVLSLTIPKGGKGDPGKDATPPTFDAQATTLAPGAEATASVTGTYPDLSVALGIPRGDKGDEGDPGPANTLRVGQVTTGAAGSNASAEITGTAPNQTLDLTIPRGSKGDNGPANVLRIGTVTSGATAAASITGTAPDQTLSLTLPQGPKGDTGNPSAVELRGTGMPEGVVSAPPGTYWTDTAGTNGAWRWIKTSGTGSTGWAVIFGDTGWRKVIANGAPNGASLRSMASPYEETPGLTAGNLIVRRIGQTLAVNVDDVQVANDALADTWIAFPPGMNPDWKVSYPGALYNLNAPSAPLRLDGTGFTEVQTGLRGVWRGTRIRDYREYPCNAPWPTTLPGSPA